MTKTEYCNKDMSSDRSGNAFLRTKPKKVKRLVVVWLGGHRSAN